MLQLLQMMKTDDQQKLASYLVKAYMKANKFNDDLADVQSNTTEQTVVHRRSLTPLYQKRPSHQTMVGSIGDDMIQAEEANGSTCNDGQKLDDDQTLLKETDGNIIKEDLFKVSQHTNFHTQPS